MIPKIEALMSKEVLAVASRKSVQDAAVKMDRNKVGSLLVMSDGEYVGIITESDIIRKVVARKRAPDTTMVKEVMTSPLIAVETDQTILEANELMEKRGLRHLVVKRLGEVVGVVSVRDFLHPIDIMEEEEKDLAHVVGL